MTRVGSQRHRKKHDDRNESRQCKIFIVATVMVATCFGYVN